MNANNKEAVFEELRNYHTERFPEKIEDSQLHDLRIKFGELEDQIIGMILSLVNGKTEFVDSSEDLNSFQDRLNTISRGEKQNDPVENIFASKISKLLEILDLTKKFDFQLRPARRAKAVVA